MVDSILATATYPDRVELVTYVDDDDPSYEGVNFDLTWIQVHGPRYHDGLVNLSIKWNRCYDASTGAILMHCGDDIVFRTAGWDVIVRDAFDDVPDGILFAYGRDGYQDGNQFGTHGFIHRAWVETVGFFVPPLFSSDFNDTFLNDVAKTIDRHREIPIYTEHMHYICGKADVDTNTRERLERHQRDRPDLVYESAPVQGMIRAAAEKLRGIMDEDIHHGDDGDPRTSIHQAS